MNSGGILAEARFVAEEEGKDMILDPTSSEGGNKERGETATAAFSFPLTAPRGESPSCNTTRILGRSQSAAARVNR